MGGEDSIREPRKTLKAVPDKTFGNLLRLVFEEGGAVPAHLDGLYKSASKAQAAIDYYNKGYDRKKIYPRAPVEKKVEEPQSVELPAIAAPKPAPQKKKKVSKKKAVKRSVEPNAEAKNEG